MLTSCVPWSGAVVAQAMMETAQAEGAGRAGGWRAVDRLLTRGGLPRGLERASAGEFRERRAGRGSSPDGVVTCGQRQVEVPRRRRPIAVAVHDDAVGSRRFLGFSAVGSRLDVALRRELGGDAGVVLERRVVGQHAPDVVAVAPRVVPHSQSLAARAVRVFPRRVSKAVEHVRLDEEGIVARDVCRVAVAVRVAQLEMDLAGKTNAAFVFIKPHACNEAMVQFVKEELVKKKSAEKTARQMF